MNAKPLIEPSNESNQVAEKVLDAAFIVHREMGPGLLESVYEACMVEVLHDQGLLIEKQKEIPVYFRQKKLDVGFRADIVVDECVLVELKSVDKLTKIHTAQIINYLKLSKLHLGLLLNFNVPLMRDGIRRFVSS